MNKQSTIKKNNPVVFMLKSNIGIISVMFIIAIGLTLLTPKFMTVNNVISVLRQISNNVFLALGMTMVIILGGIDLSVGSIVAMSGTLTVGFMVNNGLPMAAAIAAGLLLGAVVGLVNGIIVATFKVPAFIVTLIWNYSASCGVYDSAYCCFCHSSGKNKIWHIYLCGGRKQGIRKAIRCSY